MAHTSIRIIEISKTFAAEHRRVISVDSINPIDPRQFPPFRIFDDEKAVVALDDIDMLLFVFPSIGSAVDHPSDSGGDRGGISLVMAIKHI